MGASTVRQRRRLGLIGSWFPALALLLILPTSASASIASVHPDDRYLMGLSGSNFKTTIPSCDEGSGGCTSTAGGFGPAASYKVPESGGVIGISLGVKGTDEYSAALALLREGPGTHTKIGFPELEGSSFPFANVVNGVDRTIDVDISDDPLSVAKGEQIALDTVGPAGPSLLDAPPGAATAFYVPALAAGDTRAFPGPGTTNPESYLPLLLTVERQANLGLHVFVIPDIKRGLVRNAKAEVLFYAENVEGPAIARDVELTYSIRPKPSPSGTDDLGFITPLLHAAPGTPVVTSVIGPFKWRKAGAQTIKGSLGSPTRDSNPANNSVRKTVRVKGRKHRDFVPPPKCRSLLAGTPDDDRLRGSRGDDLIISLAGDDDVNARSGDDCVFGGPDRDTGKGGSGKDAIFGEEANDTLRGNGGPDYLDGGEGNDKLLAVGGGLDRLDCGPGRRDVAKADRRDRVARNCERVKRG